MVDGAGSPKPTRSHGGGSGRQLSTLRFERAGARALD
jgi:hypothetical protein